MRCIILVAGHSTRLEHEIKSEPSMSALHNVPKALLPVGDGVLLDNWWTAVKNQQFSNVTLVTDADTYKVAWSFFGCGLDD